MNVPPSVQKLIDQTHQLSALHSELLATMYRAADAWQEAPSPVTIRALLEARERVLACLSEYSFARVDAREAIHEFVRYSEKIEFLDYKRLPSDFYDLMHVAKYGPETPIASSEERKEILQRLYAMGRVSLIVLERERIEPIPTGKP